MTETSFTGILLAGGMSRRYGSPKAFATLGDRTFYEISYDNLRSLCDHVVIVTQQNFVSRFPSHLHVVTDDPTFKGLGPLAGIYTAMQSHTAHNYVVLPCDMPLLRHGVLNRLRSYHTKDVTVVTVDGRIQPLVSIWNKRTKQAIERCLKEKKLKMTNVLDRLQTVYVANNTLTDDTFIFMNVNTQEDDEEMRKWHKSSMR